MAGTPGGTPGKRPEETDLGRPTLRHVTGFVKELEQAGISTGKVSPKCYPLIIPWERIFKGHETSGTPGAAFESILMDASFDLRRPWQVRRLYLQCPGSGLANAQTGNMVLVGQSLALGQWAVAAEHLIPVVAFATGVFAAEAVRNRFHSHSLAFHWRQAVVLGGCDFASWWPFCPASSICWPTFW